MAEDFQIKHTRSFQQLQQYTNEPDSCFGQAGKLLGDKRLVQYNAGKPSPSLPSAMCAAADRVGATDLQHACAVQSLYHFFEKFWKAKPACMLMDCHARRVLEAISRSRYLGLTSSSLNCLLDSGVSTSGQAAASSLDIAQYFSQSQSTDESQLDACRAHSFRHSAHIDRGLLTLIWSDNVSGLQVDLQNMCLLVLKDVHM